MRDGKPPASEPLLLGDDHQTSAAWIAFFDVIAQRLADSELRHTAHEARLALGEARLAAIEARLLAAGIP